MSFEHSKITTEDVRIGCNRALTSQHSGWFSVAVLLAALTTPAQADGIQVYTDPAILRSMLLSHRSGVESLSVSYSEVLWERNSAGTPFSWSVAWDSQSFSTQILRPGGEGLAVDGSRRSWNGASGMGAVVYFDPTDGVGECEVSSEPSKLHLAEPPPAYCGLLGLWPTRTLAGGEPILNNPLELLGREDVVVLPNVTLIEGHECVVLECRRESGVPIFRASIAPDLNFAVVQSEVVGWNGAVLSMNLATEFVVVDPDTVALPTKGYVRTFDGEGAVSSERQITVDLVDDIPQIFAGVGPGASAFSMPEGFAVTNVDTGEQTIAGQYSPPGARKNVALASIGVLGLIAAGFFGLRWRRPSGFSIR